ncbi:MAG: hypothetical protein ABIJ09_07585 [Pseudomonadota bacterium]
MANTPQPALSSTPPRPRQWLGGVGVLLLFLALAVAQTWGYFEGWSSTTRVRDWVVYQAALETTRQSVREYREVPAWDPWRCGGAPHLANPFVDALSPWGALVLLLDVAPTVRLNVLVHLLAAMLGMWWWARRRGLDVVPALAAALAFGLSGFFIAATSWGFAFLLPAAYLPLVLAGYEAGRERWTGALPAAAAVALMLLEGGLGVAQASLFLLSLLVLIDLRQHAQPRLLILRSASVVVVGALVLAAVKWWPMALHLQQAAMAPLQSDTLTLTQLVEIFLGRDLGHRAPGFRLERFEYFGYMGPLVVAAVAWGLWHVREPGFWRIYVLAGLWTLLVLGNQGPWLPYAWLGHLPWLHAMLSAPSRLAVMLGALWALVFGLVLQRALVALRARWPGRPWQAVLALVPLLLVGDQLWLAQRAWRVHPFAGDAIARERGPFHLVDGDRPSQLANQRQNKGTIRCYELMPVSPSKVLRRGVQSQAWLEPASAGQLEVERQSPNRWILDVKLGAAARVLVNQNAAPGWSVEGELPATLHSVDGVLALDLPAGQGRLTLHYRTPGLLPAALLSALAWLALLIGILRAGWRRHRVAHPY